MRKSLYLALILSLSVSAFAQTKKRHINLPNRNVNAPFSDAVIVGDRGDLRVQLVFAPVER